LVPYYWFLNLKEAGSNTLLKDDMAQYGLLRDKVTPGILRVNPDGLPIGFARQDEDQDLGMIKERHWMGLTCAACHTGAITPKPGSNPVKQGLIIIDGAPSTFNGGAFLSGLRDALQATADNPTRLRDLAYQVLKKKDGTSLKDIEARFKKYTQEMEKVFPLYIPQNLGGPGRLDCFGAIINRATVYDIKSNQSPPAKLDAPVDFPFIWYTDRQDRIQWFGDLPNKTWLDRLERNTGEVCGVFAQVVVAPQKRLLGRLKGYASSLNAKGLGRIDISVSSLTAPKWTDVFPAPDALAVNRGKVIFKGSCQAGGCHQDLAAKNQVASVLPTPLHQTQNSGQNLLPDLDTDANNTNMVHFTQSAAGVLEGTPSFVIAGPPLKAPVNANAIVGNVAAGMLIGRKGDVLAAYLDYLLRKTFGASYLQAQVSKSDKNKKMMTAQAEITSTALSKVITVEGSTTNSPPIVGYESRSLSGIWATAPYLHNGSVPNLFELLWPDLRESTFYVGSHVYDPEKAGFVTEKLPGSVQFDTSQPGNSNKGHTYGSTLSPGDRDDLLAYLKTL